MADLIASLTIMTELEAVNRVLTTIGLERVSTIDTTQEATEKAVEELKDTSRDLQAMGWRFNTDKEYPITAADGTGYVTLPSTALSAEVTDYKHPGADFVQREGKIYDRKNRTFDLSSTATVYVTLISAQDFTDLPYAAQMAITSVAAVRLLNKGVGSREQYQLAKEEAQAAMANLHAKEGRERNANLMTGFSAGEETLLRTARNTFGNEQ